MPGEFRRSQNWIGGSRPGNAAFVPPPPNHVQECMADLERFIRGLSAPTVAAVLQLLARLGIVREITGRQRGKVFTYEQAS